VCPSDVIEPTTQYLNISTTHPLPLPMPLFSLIMGASASKSAKSAGSAVRKYPTRAPANTTIAAAAATATRAAAAPTQRVTPGPSFHPPVEAAETKTEGE